MERYVEITVADLLDYISKKETENIYYKKNGNLYPLIESTSSINSIHFRKWFKREVIE